VVMRILKAIAVCRLIERIKYFELEEKTRN